MHVMKFLRFLVPIAFLFCLAGCLDIDEGVQVKNDGSGRLTMDMDMSRMVDMLKSAMSKEDLEKKGLQKMDTTINMKDVVDSNKKLSEEKKALLRPGTIHVQLDLDANVFRAHMQFPFTSMDNLQKLYTTLMNENTMKDTKLFGSQGTDAPEGGGGDDPNINQFNGIYDFSCKDGHISKTLNQEKWKALKDQPEMAQMKQASDMGMGINYTTVFQLPRPVKKIDNPSAKLSEDKKTVTIKYNLGDIFDHPEQFSYNIDY
jgi:hypothetical protein